MSQTGTSIGQLRSARKWIFMQQLVESKVLCSQAQRKSMKETPKAKTVQCHGRALKHKRGRGVAPPTPLHKGEAQRQQVQTLPPRLFTESRVFFFARVGSAMCAERHKSPSRGFREMSLTTKTGSTSQNTNTKNTNQNNQQARTKGQTQSPYESK